MRLKGESASVSCINCSLRVANTAELASEVSIGSMVAMISTQALNRTICSSSWTAVPRQYISLDMRRKPENGRAEQLNKKSLSLGLPRAISEINRHGAGEDPGFWSSQGVSG